MRNQRTWIRLLAVTVILLAAGGAHAVITAPPSLEAVLKQYPLIVVAKVEKLYPEKPAMMLAIAEDLKGKSSFGKLPVSCATVAASSSPPPAAPGCSSPIPRCRRRSYAAPTCGPRIDRRNQRITSALGVLDRRRPRSCSGRSWATLGSAHQKVARRERSVFVAALIRDRMPTT